MRVNYFMSELTVSWMNIAHSIQSVSLCAGTITREELVLAYKSMGDSYSNDDIDRMLKEVDLNGDGKIDYKEFCAMINDSNAEPVRRRIKIKF